MDEKIKKMNLAISKINATYAKWYEGMSVSGARQQVLLALAAEPGISQKEIVSSYLVPKQTVSKEIHLMQEEGLLELLPDDEDKRGKKIVMTEKGQKYTEEILQPYFDMESRIEKRMNPRAYRQMIDGLTAYADALGQEVNHER
ncbi:MAG: MarR family winged helix-turn-helix transcriptional regulator [Lachnospiraceae bacterium]